MELKDRLAEALAYSGKNKIGLARFCNVSHPSVSNWFNGRTKDLSAKNALAAAQYLGVNVEWLSEGKGEMTPSVVAIFEDDKMPTGVVAIPEYRINFGAGDHDAPTYDEITDAKPAYFREDWFVAHKTSPEKCKRFKVHGNSMYPILFDGDSIVVECSPGQPIISGKIYAFGFGGDMRVKRLYTLLNGGLTVKSENPEVPDETIDPEDMGGFYLIGRVIDRSGSSPF